jgi:hypothetical protein
VLYGKTRTLVSENKGSSGEEIFVQVFTCILRNRKKKFYPERKSMS